MTDADSKNACPCSHETAEQLTASPEPDRVVTLVHGTFASHAEWMREGPLCDALQPDDPDDPAALPGKTLFSRFCWTGGNSHTERLRAGEDLADHLRGLADKFRNARHFVVGHSHGGNVMLYAMKDETLAERVAGLVTLSTPFITVRRRKLHPLIFFSVSLVVLIASLEAGLAKWCPTPTKGLEYCPSEAPELQGSLLLPIVVLFFLWLLGTGLSAWIYRGGEFGLGDLLALVLRRQNAEGIVTTELERLKLTPDRSERGASDDSEKKQLEKMLVARPFGDEASMSLVVSQFLSWVQNRILTGLGSSINDFRKLGWFSWIWKLVLVIALAMFLQDKLPYIAEVLSGLMGATDAKVGMVKGGIAGLAVLAAWGFLAIFVLFGLLSLAGLLVLLVAGLAFGPDAMFWNHYASTTAESSPPGPARVFLQSPPPADPTAGSSGLAHSGIYIDPKVIQEIVDWVRMREAALAQHP